MQQLINKRRMIHYLDNLESSGTSTELVHLKIISDELFS